MIKFSKSHEWVKIENDSVTIGISDHAQKELGDIVFVELPQVSEKIVKDEQFGTVESTKAASELYAPVSGEVIGVNEELLSNPQWINQLPLDKGWMIKVRLADKEELEALLDESAYSQYIENE